MNNSVLIIVPESLRALSCSLLSNQPTDIFFTVHNITVRASQLDINPDRTPLVGSHPNEGGGGGGEERAPQQCETTAPQPPPRTLFVSTLRPLSNPHSHSPFPSYSFPTKTSTGGAPPLYRSLALLSKALSQPVATLDELVDASADAGLLFGRQSFRGEVIDAVFETSGNVPLFLFCFVSSQQFGARGETV